MVLMQSCMYFLQPLKIVSILLIAWNPFLVFTSADNGIFTNCGGFLEHSKGVIHSPNFPNPFPTPIFCEWVIHAPRSKKIMIYFTQYYLKDHFDVLEYDYYADRNTHVGETKLATVNHEDEIWSVAGHKSYVVLRFYVQWMGNIHLRVLQDLMDVYGFNITYEFADRSSNDIKEACSVSICSYLGNCIASADFSEYKCQCFPGYFGDHCQYGPHCDPLNNKNMCKNNGKCRYFFGAYVNYCECPPGFYGTQCELKDDGLMQYACQELGCEQQCLHDQSSNKSVCACNQGFILNKDNRTCHHIDRYRITVSVHPSENFTERWMTESLIRLYEVVGEQIFHDFFSKLYDFGMDSMDLFEMLGFRNTSAGVEFQIIFYVEKYEMSKVSPILSGIIGTGRIGPLHLRDDFVHLIAEPELYISHVATRVGDYDSHPAIEGHDMTLSCAAKGSPNIKFRWFKDGALINTKMSRREAFETSITSSTEEIIRSVLTIDAVSPFDKGEYTCEASDYGKVKNKSIIVDVITLPLVDIGPLSSSVLPGDSVTVRCMSPDDTLNSFKYEWFTDGYQIKSGKSSFRVEYLAPTGIRLFIKNIRKSANFTCCVTNEAGAVNVTAHIYVPKHNETSMICDENYFEDVLWRRTGGNHFDKQRCPTETGDHSRYSRRDVGYATRKCICNAKTNKCEWAHPNFASCQSIILVQIYDQIEKLRLGYQHTTLNKVYQTLNNFVVTRKDGLYSGDVEMAGSILLQILRHLRNFPILAKQDKKISAQSIIRLMDLMLLGASSASNEEMQMLHTGTSFIRIADLLAGGITRYLEFTPHIPIKSNLIDMNVKDATFHKEDGQNQPVLKLSQSHRRVKRNLRDDSLMEDYGRPVQVMEFIYRRLDVLLKPKALKRSLPADHAVSDINSAYLFPGDNYTFRSVYADLPITHKHLTNTKKPYNTMECLSWKFDSRTHQGYSKFGNYQLYRSSLLTYKYVADVACETGDAYSSGAPDLTSSMFGVTSFDHRWLSHVSGFPYFNVKDSMTGATCGAGSAVPSGAPYFASVYRRRQDYGVWASSDCYVQQTSPKYTVCRCRIPGHFLVVAVQRNLTIAPVSEEDHSGVYILVGCVVLMCGVAATLGIYLLKWKQLVGGEYLINLNFLICLLALTCVFLLCLHQRHVEVVCIVCRILIYFFFLGAFSFVLTESLHLFLWTNSRGKLANYCYKYMLLGWSIPFVLTSFFVLASEIFGKDRSCTYTCWVERDHWHLYAFAVPVALMILLYVVFMMLAFRMCVVSNDEWKFNKRRKLTYGYSKSLTLLALLLAMSLLSIDIHDQRQTPQILLFLICNILLSLFIFIFKGILDKQLLIVFWKMETKKKKKRSNSNEEKIASGSFRAYIKPERQESDTMGKEQDSVNEYYEKVNRMNFTKERKQHLSSLLGSNVNSRNNLGSIIGSTYMMRQEMNNRNGTRDTFGTDSGIYVGSENEKFLSHNSSDSVNQIPSRSNGKMTVLTQVHVHNDDHSSINNSDQLDDEFVFEDGNRECFPLYTIKDNYVIKTPRPNGFPGDEESSAVNKNKMADKYLDKEESRDELSVLLHSIDHDG